MDLSFEQINRLWELYGPYALTAIRVIVIVIVASIVVRLITAAIVRFRARTAARHDDPEALKRADTLARVARYLAVTIVWLLTFTLVLGQIGISVAPILGAAGVVGLAVGFGAQSLVKDYFTGFVMLLENQLRAGDVVNVAGHSGAVEDVTLRYVRLRDYDGNVHYVPNSSITTVINMSRDFGQAAVEIGIAYGSDIDQAMAVMREVAAGMQADEKYGALILEPLDIAGVDQWADSSVVIKGRIKTKALQQWTIKREFLRRLKYAFDQADIEIPFPYMTLATTSPLEVRQTVVEDARQVVPALPPAPAPDAG